ncbi:MAG: ABC transporter ATP-binding protein [Bryobacteraceae bacterium]|nr:ABC transporter ATP-binding protein [Bryobacteraceae bacterium]
MALVFREVNCPPLEQVSVTAPNGAVIGIIGEDGSGKRALLRLAAGLGQPVSGLVDATEPRRLLGVGEPLNLAPAGTLALDHAFAMHDALVRARALAGIERLRRAGVTVLVASHEQDLLRAFCDEIWWLKEGRIAAKGDPREVLDKYNRHIAGRLQEWGRSIAQPLAPSLRRGDGRAEVAGLETLDASGRPAMVWQSGAEVAARVTVRFAKDVADPVVGIMIRTRIGFEVFGTNTELEGAPLGPCAAGTTLRVTFSFCCNLCPQEYTLTAASHDPDGVWHDWLEDALAFSVADSRYTAGVANLRASVTVERM